MNQITLLSLAAGSYHGPYQILGAAQEKQCSSSEWDTVIVMLGFFAMVAFMMWLMTKD